MLPHQPKSIPLDDLQEGKQYHFRYRNGSFVRGPFGGFVVKKGCPLVIRVPKGREVYCIPASLLTGIFPI